MTDDLQHIDKQLVASGEQEDNNEALNPQINLDSYKYYLEKINKALEQSNLLTNSFFQDQNNFSYGQEDNENQQLSDKQLIQDLEQKSKEYQQFYGIQDLKSLQPQTINSNHLEFNSEQFEQNRFDKLSQEISNRIQERAQATVVTEASNQFDLHTIEEEDMTHEEDQSTEKKKRQKQSDQFEDQSLNSIKQQNQNFIDSNKEEDDQNDQQFINIQNNHIMQIDELNEEIEQRQKPPSPIIQEKEPFQYKQYYQQQQNLLQQQQLQYQQQIQQYQQLQQQYQQIPQYQQSKQQNGQKQSQQDFYYQEDKSQQQTHLNNQQKNQEQLSINQQKQQQFQQPKYQQGQFQSQFEQQQLQQESQYIQQEQQQVLQQNQDTQQNQQQIITIKGNRYHLQNIQPQQQPVTVQKYQSPQSLLNPINENDTIYKENAQTEEEQEDVEYQYELTTEQQPLEFYTFQQSNIKQQEFQQSNYHDVDNISQDFKTFQPEQSRNKNNNKNINNKKLGSNPLFYQDLAVSDNGNYALINSQRQAMNNLNSAKISTNSSEKGVITKNVNSTQSQQTKKKINNFMLPSQSNALPTQNRKNMISPQNKNNNQYYLQESLTHQQFISSPSSRDYSSLNSQYQPNSMHSMYQQNMESQYFQEQQNYKQKENNLKYNNYMSLNQLQQEKLKIEKEQKEEKEKKHNRQIKQTKEYSQNSINHISTQSSNQNDYFPSYPKANQNNSNIFKNGKNNISINNSGYYDDQNKSQQSFHNMKKKQLSLSNLNTPNSINQLSNNLAQNINNSNNNIKTKDQKKYQPTSTNSPLTKRSNIRSPQTMINKEQIIKQHNGKAGDKNKQMNQERNQSPIDINAIRKITDELLKQQALKVQQNSIDQSTQRQARMLIQNGQVGDAINKMVLYQDDSSRKSHSRTPSKTRNTHTSKISNQKIKEQEIQRFKHAIVVHSDNLKPKKAVKQQKDMNNQYFTNYFNESPIKKQSTPHKLQTKELQSDRGILFTLENFSKTQSNGFDRKEVNSNTSQQSLTSRNQNLNKQSHNNVQLKTLIL